MQRSAASRFTPPVGNPTSEFPLMRGRCLPRVELSRGKAASRWNVDGTLNGRPHGPSRGFSRLAATRGDKRRFREPPRGPASSYTGGPRRRTERHALARPRARAVTRTVAAAVRGAGGGTPAVSPRSQPRWRQGPRGNTLSALRRAGLPNSAPAGRSPDLDRSSIEAVLLCTVR